MFKFKSRVHTINIRHCSDLYLPSANLLKVQKRVHHSGVKVFSCLPPRIKSLFSNVRKFMAELKGFVWKVPIILFKNILTGTLRAITVYFLNFCTCTRF
jgi:hypothetical protein